jgi:hypothetical protein
MPGTGIKDWSDSPVCGGTPQRRPNSESKALNLEDPAKFFLQEGRQGPYIPAHY